MRSSAACLTLLLLLSMISVVGIQRSNAYEIVYHDLFKEIHQAKKCASQPCECGIYNYECQSNRTRAHTFTLNDLRVYLVVYLRTEKVDVSSPLTLGLSAEWRDPTGKVILRTQDLKKKFPEMVGYYVDPPYADANTNWMYYDQLEIRAAPAYGQSRPLGLYTVTVFERGRGRIFTEYFGIGHYPLFLNVEGLPEGEYVGYNVDGVESGRLETGNMSVMSFPISESHTISTPKTVLSSAQEQFECTDCTHTVTEEASLSFHYSRSVSATTTVTTQRTSRVITAATSTPIIPATVTVTERGPAPTDFATLSLGLSVAAICAVVVLAVVVLWKRAKPPRG